MDISGFAYKKKPSKKTKSTGPPACKDPSCWTSGAAGAYPEVTSPICRTTDDAGAHPEVPYSDLLLAEPLLLPEPIPCLIHIVHSPAIEVLFWLTGLYVPLLPVVHIPSSPHYHNTISKMFIFISFFFFTNFFFINISLFLPLSFHLEWKCRGKHLFTTLFFVNVLVNWLLTFLFP